MSPASYLGGIFLFPTSLSLRLQLSQSSCLLTANSFSAQAPAGEAVCLADRLSLLSVCLATLLAHIVVWLL
jgi:hypothetical protein